MITKDIQKTLKMKDDHGRDDFETTIKEALYIKSSRPKLNKQLYTQGSSFILSVFWI